MSGLAAWVIEVIERLGYLGIAALIALENIFPPIPSEVILTLGGFLVGQGRFSFVVALVAATFGAVVGAWVLYGIGAVLGEARVRWLIRRYGRWAMLKEEDLDKAVGWFERHGGKAVFLCRFVPLVRSLISLPAGIARMSLPRFTLYTTLGSVGWNAVLIGLGWYVGDQWERIAGYMDYFQYAVILVIGAAVLWFIWQRRGALPWSGRRESASR